DLWRGGHSLPTVPRLLLPVADRSNALLPVAPEVLASFRAGATMFAMSIRPPPRGDSQPDLFAATFADIPIRDQRDMMERPFFSLAKTPCQAPIEYSVGDVWVKVSANHEFGMATIWDADILIWAATQITEALDRGLDPSRTIQFHPYNLLKSV